MPLSETAQATTSSRVPNIAANAAFVPIGIVTILLGPMLPSLSAQWSLSYGQAGSLFTAQFVASTAAVLLSGALIARLGFRFTINAGLLAMAVPLAALPFSSYPLGVACIALYGAGSGLAVPAANLLVAEVDPTCPTEIELLHGTCRALDQSHVTIDQPSNASTYRPAGPKTASIVSLAS